jgi:hypothetical protein
MDHPSPRLLNRGHRAPGGVPPDHSGEVPGPIASPVLGGRSPVGFDASVERALVCAVGRGRLHAGGILDGGPLHGTRIFLAQKRRPCS